MKPINNPALHSTPKTAEESKKTAPSSPRDNKKPENAGKRSGSVSSLPEPSLRGRAAQPPSPYVPVLSEPSGTRAQPVSPLPMGSGETAASLSSRPRSHTTMPDHAPIASITTERRKGVDFCGPPMPHSVPKPRMPRLDFGSAGLGSASGGSQLGFAHGLNNNSASAPTTPRSPVGAREEEGWHPNRQRVNSSPRKPTSPRSLAQREVMPSPRRPDPELMRLGNETARLILDAMRSALKVLKPEHVASFARTEFKVAITAASPTLLNTVKSETNSVLSHARLINALFAKKLADSQVGKAMLSLRKAVMDQYDGHTFTLKDFDAMEEEQLAFKKRQLLNMEDQAKACAQIFLEVDQYDLSSSKLPPELIAFWKTIDHGLCAWAAENPQLDQKDLSAARSNLGFDLLVTRLALPLLAGPESESHLVIPQQFCSAAKNAIVKNWPDFFDRFLVATGLERGSQAKETQATVGVASALPAAAPGQGAGASASLAAPSFDASVSGRDEKGGE